MTQMVQSYNISKLTKDYLKQHPNTSNDDLYSLCNATTDSQKSSVRKKKQRLRYKGFATDNSIIIPGTITSITPESVETLILSRINGQLNNVSDALVRSAVDFLIKVKMSEGEEMEQLDMEQFIYDSTKQESSS